MSDKIKFQKGNRDFHKAVVERVDDYFKSTGKSKGANGFMYFKTYFYITFWLGSYLGLLFGEFSLLTNNLLWIVYGLSSVFMAVNCGHDAIHGSFSSKKWVNNFYGNTFNIIGANSYIWAKIHNVVHHTFTNIAGHDEDIESVPIARLAPSQEWKPIQKYQHIWLFFLYPLGTLSWVFKKDYIKFFQKKIGTLDNSSHPRKEYFRLFFFKFLYYFLFIALPIIMIDMPWYTVVGGFILGHLFGGFAIVIIFMLAHVVEEAHFPMPDNEGNIEDTWAVSQMRTTVDFGRKSALTSFIAGGLNFQVEHHLFPKICHIHYPEVSDIVKKTAEDYGVPYNELPSFYAAFKSHVRFLKKLGNNQIPQSIEITPKKEDLKAKAA
jgi:linoleoyl-CoA desaturase